MNAKFYLNFLKAGVLLSFCFYFLVFKSFLFPFITSKQISFNILMEILLIFLFLFLFKYPEYRSKKSFVSAGLISFFLIVFLSCFTGVDFNLSFWGDIERMLGFFHIFHFLIFYFLVITAFRTENDWKLLFLVSIISCTFVSLLGLPEGKLAHSTIGNTAYVSGLILFNIYFSILLFWQEKKKDFKWISLLYFIPVLIMMIEFAKTNTTGAWVALLFSLTLMFFLYGVLVKNKKIRIFVISIFLIFILLVVSIWLNRKSDFIKNNYFLRPFVNITFEKATFQTRLISWRAAFKDIKNNFLLGTGHGNYAITFDKHFEPALYNYTRQGTYFDRAHNNIIDIFSTTGIFGLITYLSIFVAVAYYLIRTYFFDKSINIHEFIILSCLFVAYFIQNLAVFDSFVTYISLMITLAYVYYIHEKKEKLLDKIKSKFLFFSRDKLKEQANFFGSIFIIFILIILYLFNFQPIQMLRGTIAGQTAFAQKNYLQGFEIYKNTLLLDTVLDRDSRASLIKSLLANPGFFNSIDKKKADEILEYLIEISKRNLAYNPLDSLMNMQVSNVYTMAATYYRNKDKIKSDDYYNKALEYIDKSIKASPKRSRIYFQKAQIYLSKGEKEKAIEVMTYSTTLDDKYYDSFCYLSRILLSAEDTKERGYADLDKCIDLGGASLFQSNELKMFINYYANKGDLNRVLILYKRLSIVDKNDSKVWINLSKLYKELNNFEDAKRAALKAVELDSNLKDSVEEYIKTLDQKLPNNEK